MDEKQKEEVAGLDIGSLPVETSEEAGSEEKETQDNAGGSAETSEEENKVSYSRFKNIHTRYKESEQRAAELEARLEELESTRAERIEREEPSFEGSKYRAWKKLFYGNENAVDTTVMQEQYRTYMTEFSGTVDESYIRQVAAQAYRDEARSEERRIASNERTLDEQLEDVSISVGRDLTEDEQVAILEIQDEFSAKNEDGMIISLYPAEKAWELYEIQSQGPKTARTQTRNRIAALTGSGTRGETTVTTGQKSDKDFDPRWEALDASMSRRR